MNTTPAQSSLETETQVRLRRAWVHRRSDCCPHCRSGHFQFVRPHTRSLVLTPRLASGLYAR